MQTLHNAEVNAQDFDKLEQVLTYLDKAHKLIMEIKENIVPYDEFTFDFHLVNSVRLAISATKTLISENKVPEETVDVTFGEIFDRVWKSETFDAIGINEWCLAEGLASREDVTTLTKEQAKNFMSENEFQGRKYAK